MPGTGTGYLLRMDPTPDTPFAEVGPDWHLIVRCRCNIVAFIAAYRERHFPPDMTAARLVERGRCETCRQRPREAAWEWARVGPGGLRLGSRRVVVK